MKRDISKIKRDLENVRNNDIILKKDKIKKMFNEDPDLLEVLGQLQKKPLNTFKNPDNPTTEEIALRKEIEEYNSLVSHEQIIPYLKLNGIQKEVSNFILFDIDDTELAYGNKAIKIQHIIIMCLVHEDDMETEYGILRTDLLSYIVKDLLNYTNALGLQFHCVNEFQDIIDSRYHCRTLKFEAEVPNTNMGHPGMNNKYDRFKS